MTDRIEGFTVILEQRIRADDAVEVANLLRQIRGVVAVEPVVSTADVHLAAARRDAAWRKRLYDVIRGGPD